VAAVSEGPTALVVQLDQLGTAAMDRARKAAQAIVEELEHGLDPAVIDGHILDLQHALYEAEGLDAARELLEEDA
jgi:hypothetical protein